MTHSLCRHGDIARDPYFPLVQRRGPPPAMWAEVVVDDRVWVVVAHKHETARHVAVSLASPRDAAFFRRSAS